MLTCTYDELGDMQTAIEFEDIKDLAAMRASLGDEKFYMMFSYLTPDQSAKAHHLLAIYDRQCLRAGLTVACGLAALIALVIFNMVNK